MLLSQFNTKVMKQCHPLSSALIQTATADALTTTSHSQQHKM